MKGPGRSILVAALCLSLLALAPPLVSVGSAHPPCGCPQAYACGCPCPQQGMMGGGMMMHGGMAGGGMMPGPMRMEAMKEHLDQIRKAVAALRKNEQNLATARDPAAFRAAATEQFRMLDNVLESHLRHMEAMMSRMPMTAPPGGTTDGSETPPAEHHPDGPPGR